MVHKLIEQFLGDVFWGPLDYLLVDMPPGTGDAQLSLAQIVPLSGAVLVTTRKPSRPSTWQGHRDVPQVNVELLGIVENMSGYVVEGTIIGAKAGTKVSLNAAASRSSSRPTPGPLLDRDRRLRQGRRREALQAARLPGARPGAAAPAGARRRRRRRPDHDLGSNSPVARIFEEIAGASRSASRSSRTRRCGVLQ
jgi:hypothetical protein